MKQRALAMLILVSAVACFGRSDKTVSYSSTTGTVKMPDDIAITTTDGSMVLAVRHDTLLVRLSDKVRADASGKLDTSKVKGDGFGASIERFVKNSVDKGLSTEVSEPLSDFNDAKVENGTLIIVPRDKSKSPPFDHTKVNDRPLMQSFSQTDAEGFAAYVRARIVKGF